MNIEGIRTRYLRPHRTEEGSGRAPPLTAEEVEALTLTAEANRVL